MNERPVSRLGVALLSAAAAAPFPLALMLVASAPQGGFSLLFVVMLVGFPVAVAHALLFALPAYGLLRRHWRLMWWNSAAAGFLIGALPTSLLSWWNLGAMATMGACGLLGGLVFWLILRARPESDSPEDLRRTFT